MPSVVSKNMLFSPNMYMLYYCVYAYAYSCPGDNESAIACDIGLYSPHAEATNESACQVFMILVIKIF